jgi:hypothetical protein
MWKDSGYVKCISPPKVEYSMPIDHMQKISNEKTIGELPIGGLSRYRRVYDKKIFDSFDRGNNRFADDASYATREKATCGFGRVFR